MAYLDPLEAAKVALYITMRGAGLTNVGLAARLRMDEKAVRRMLDLDQRTRIDAIHDVLRHIFSVYLVHPCAGGGVRGIRGARPRTRPGYERL